MYAYDKISECGARVTHQALGGIFIYLVFVGGVIGLMWALPLSGVGMGGKGLFFHDIPINQSGMVESTRDQGPKQYIFGITKRWHV